MVWLIFPIVVILSAVAYRLGGRGGAWWANTKVRDLGVPTVCLGWLYFALGCPWWAYFLTVGIMYGSLTTYNKWLTRLIYGKEVNDVKWCSWAFTGLTYGVSTFLLAWTSGHWAGFIYRSIILAITTCVWSEIIGEDWLEEGGRGALIALTLPLLLI